MNTIKTLVEESDTPAGRLFDLVVQLLIVVSIISYSISTLPNLSETQLQWLWIIEVVTVAFFTVEYVLRLIVAENKLKHTFSFFAIIDLLAILPFFLSAGIDTRGLRAMRLVRLVRILKLARYSEATKRFARAFVIAREEFVLFFCFTLIVFFLAAAGIHHFEAEAQPEQFGDIFSSMWWAVVTLTTVGYGDAYPVTIGGKIFTGALLLLVLSLVAVPAGIISSALSQAKEEARRTEIQAR